MSDPRDFETRPLPVVGYEPVAGQRPPRVPNPPQPPKPPKRPPTDARAPRPERRRKRRRGPLIALIVVAAIVLGVGGYGAYAFTTLKNAYHPSMIDVLPVDADSAKVTETGATNILLLGIDGQKSPNITATSTGQRADSILLVHVPKNGKGIAVMSILRDSWITIPGHGKAKINAAMSLGGVKLMVRTVQNLLGTRIDHVGLINFKGFASMSKALGGVDVKSSVAFTTTYLTSANKTYHFKKGINHIQGKKALAFVRERHAFATGDYQRAQNQQAFIKGLLNEVVSKDTLTDVGKLASFTDATSDYLIVDSTLGFWSVLGLALKMRNVDTNNIPFFTLPTDGTGYEGGQSIVVVDRAKLKKIKTAFADDGLLAYITKAKLAGSSGY
jgi:LCP family protein required for cell wall assembly